LVEEYFRIERRKRIGAWLLGLGVALLSLLYLSAGVIPIPLPEVVRLLGRWITGSREMGGERVVEQVAILQIRLPRLLAALLVGGGLAISGTAYQGLFQNRLADPFTTGVSAGAVLGCTLALVLGFSRGLWGLGGITLFAFGGALGTSLVVFLVLGVMKRASTATILLIGISLNFFLSAIVSLILFLNRNRIESIVLWTMGSVATATMEKILFALPLFVLGNLGLYFSSRFLDYLSLGKEFARAHGIPVVKARFLLILFASLVSSVCVSLSGVVGFVGLVTPNMARILVGTKHHVLFLYSLLLGMLFLLLADFLAKTLLAPAEIPIGILTSLIGVPVFAGLIWRYSRRIY